VKEHLLSKFAERQVETKKNKPQYSYSIPVRMKDKIRLHLLVLCLVIDNFEVPCSVLQKDLKVTTNKYAMFGKGSSGVQTHRR
jgi:DNA-directed RNA polymerase I subunit RPA49